MLREILQNNGAHGLDYAQGSQNAGDAGNAGHAEDAGVRVCLIVVLLFID